jgi:prepilin-type processing-associated H-X9-DG protein
LLIIERAGAPQSWRMGKNLNKPDQFAMANNSRGAWAGWGSLNYGAFSPVDGNSPARGDATDCTVNCNNFFGIYGFHAAGANVLLCDGAVRFVGTKLDGLTLARLTTRDDGQLLASDAF